MANPTIISSEWCTTEEAIQRLAINQRLLQKWAQRGHLRFKTVPQGRKRVRLYRAEDVQRLEENGGPVLRTSETPRPVTPISDATKRGVVARAPKPTQTERALDTVSIVGNLVAGHKSEMEMLVAQMGRNLETVVSMVLTAQKAESDANRERMKAEREDARERWEMERKEVRERWELERQDRLERQKARSVQTKRAAAR